MFYIELEDPDNILHMYFIKYFVFCANPHFQHRTNQTFPGQSAGI